MSSVLIITDQALALDLQMAGALNAQKRDRERAAAMRVRPLRGQVLVEILPPAQQTETGLFLPDVAGDHLQGERPKAWKGIVLKVGPWRALESGRCVLPEVQVGQTVICSPHSGRTLGRTMHDRYKLVQSEDLIAVVTQS